METHKSEPIEKITKKNIPIPSNMWLQAIIITLGAFSTMLSSTMLSAALPTMANGLGTSDIAIQWVATTYLMALAAGVPLSAWAVRRFGATELWLYGLLLFCIFSALCGLAPNFGTLLVARIGQGLAWFASTRRADHSGTNSGARALGPNYRDYRCCDSYRTIIGDFTGGDTPPDVWLAWSILGQCPVVYMCIYSISKNLLSRPTIKTDKPITLDWLAFAFILSSLPMLIAGIKALSVNNEGDGWYIFILILGILFCFLFIVRCLYSESPLLNLRLFKHSGFALSALLMAIGGSINFGGQFLLPLYFRDICHRSLAEVGLLLTPQLIGSMIGFPVAGFFSDKMTPRRVLIIGGVITTLATLPLASIDAQSSYVLVGGTIALRGFGLALATVPAMVAGMSMADPSHVADAAPILNILQRIGAVVGTSIVTIIYLRYEATDGSLSAFNHAVWILTGGAILLALAAILMPVKKSH